MEAQLAPLQSEAKRGVGKTLVIPEPARTVRFIIRTKKARRSAPRGLYRLVS
jgi:hypothetical protein